MTALFHAARTIFAEALAATHPGRAVAQALACDGHTLRLGDALVPRSEVDQLFLIAIGKAAVPMFTAAESALAGYLPLQAIVVSPNPPSLHPPHLRGGHPTPDLHSARAARAVLDLLAQATARTAVLFLISGGASALLELPLDPSLTLAEIAAFHAALVASGLPIAQMNALRKHFSRVKGGRLAQAAAAARIQATLLLSDVPDAHPDAIGSGPSLSDPSTLAGCRDLLPRLALPPRIADFFAGPLCVETPKLSHPAFQNAHWSVLLTPGDLAQAASATARRLGFHGEIDNSPDDQPFATAAEYLLDRSRSLALEHPLTCLISVGELSVQLPPDPGEGGRNQHFALFCAQSLVRRGQSATVLSAGSDGIDGNSLAAGAVCDQDTPALAQSVGLDPAAALSAFNSAPLLRALQADITTGPTGNNLRDLRLILTAVANPPSYGE